MKKRLTIPVVALTLSVLAALHISNTTAVAQAVDWTGATNGLWATGTNWDPSGLPGSGANLTFGEADNHIIDLGGTTRTFNTGTFTEDYTFSNGTLSFTGNQTVPADNSDTTVTINGVWNNASGNNNTNITRGNWILNGNITGSRFNLQTGATLTLQGSGTNSAQIYLNANTTLIYDKAAVNLAGTQVISFSSNTNAVFRAVQPVNTNMTISFGNNGTLENNSGNLWIHGGNVQIGANRTLNFTTTTSSSFRLDNWIGLSANDTARTSTFNTETNVTIGDDERGIRNWIGGSGGEAHSIIKTGTADLIVLPQGVNSYTGSTTITQGNIRIHSMAQLGNSSDAASNLAFNGGGLHYEAETDDTSSRGFTVSGSGANNGINVVESGVVLTLSGSITGAGTFNKMGDGILALTGDGSARSGSTVVQAGTLLIDGTLGGPVTVNSGAVLGGFGTLTGATVISGTHSPGNSPAVQTFDSDLTYNSDASVIWELGANTTAGRGTNFDGVDVGGDLAFAGTTTLSLSFDFIGSDVDWSDSFWNSTITGTAGWLIYDVSGETSDFGNFSIATANWMDSQGVLFNDARPLSEFSLFQDGDNIFLNYVVIPEPSTWALLIGSLAVVLIGVRRRRLNAAAASCN